MNKKKKKKKNYQYQIDKYLHSRIGEIADLVTCEWDTIQSIQPISLAKVARRMANWKNQHPNETLSDVERNKILQEKQTIHTWSYQTKWKLK